MKFSGEPNHFQELEFKLRGVRLPYYEELLKAVDAELVEKAQPKILGAIKSLGLDALPREKPRKKKLQK